MEGTDEAERRLAVLHLDMLLLDLVQHERSVVVLCSVGILRFHDPH